VDLASEAIVATTITFSELLALRVQDVAGKAPGIDIK
jgi:hypothetical protein